MFFLCIFFLIQSNEYPEWFLNPPENSISVIVKDQYSFESRFIELYLKANTQLKMRKNNVNVVGYEAYRQSNIFDNREDRFKIDYEFGESIEDDYLDRFGYQLVKMHRIRGDVVFGLFNTTGIESFSKPEKSREWINEKSTTFSSVGFTEGKNYSKQTNWEEAFKHALFQLTMNNNVMVLSGSDQKKTEVGSFIKDEKTDEQINLIKHQFKGILISKRYYNKEENMYYIKIETKR